MLDSAPSRLSKQVRQTAPTASERRDSMINPHHMSPVSEPFTATAPSPSPSCPRALPHPPPDARSSSLPGGAPGETSCRRGCFAALGAPPLFPRRRCPCRHVRAPPLRLRGHDALRRRGARRHHAWAGQPLAQRTMPKQLRAREGTRAARRPRCPWPEVRRPPMPPPGSRSARATRACRRAQAMGCESAPRHKVHCGARASAFLRPSIWRPAGERRPSR
mmetsp:Transcript_11697/g.33386  ORF Transcript_11697/g.33386 Transcript_11697/m.33386 type:complete len:219 (+) Transcript_11697:168-824(+)